MQNICLDGVLLFIDFNSIKGKVSFDSFGNINSWDYLPYGVKIGGV